jgi:hypothetical protein
MKEQQMGIAAGWCWEQYGLEQYLYSPCNHV